MALWSAAGSGRNVCHYFESANCNYIVKLCLNSRGQNLSGINHSIFNSLKMAAATQDGLSIVANFEDKMSQENPILSDMVDWEPPSQAQVEVQN